MSGVESRVVGSGLGSRLFYQSIRFAVVSICRVYCRMTIIGLNNVPKSGAFVLAPVHRSYIDTPIASGCTHRRMRFMGKESLWRHQPWRWMVSALGAFPVARGTADLQAIRRAIELLQSGEPLVLFPEGERKSGETVQPLMDGAAYVACKAGVPIIPVGIGGSERVLGKGYKFLYPRKLVVIIGSPIEVPSGADGRLERAAVKDITERLHHELQSLFDRAQRSAGSL